MEGREGISMGRRDRDGEEGMVLGILFLGYVLKE